MNAPFSKNGCLSFSKEKFHFPFVLHNLDERKMATVHFGEVSNDLFGIE